MWKKMVDFLKAPAFPDDDEKDRRARALHALHLNMGGAMLGLGTLGILFFFAEKVITSAILGVGVLVVIVGMVLNHRGQVKASGIFMVVFLWGMTVLMTILSGGMRSLDILFFISGTVIAGIILGARGSLFYAVVSLLTGLGFVTAGSAGFEFLQLFTFPPVSAWVLLFINLVFTVVPLQVALQSLSDSAQRARLSEERYRLITSIMSDYAFSVMYGPGGEVVDEWLSGAFEQITGYTPEEYFARGGWRTIVHPDDRERDIHDLAQLRANQKVVTDIRLIRKDGNTRWVRSYGHPIWDAERGQLAGIYGAVQDITDRKQIELSLRQHADEMALLYNITLTITSSDDLYHALRALVKELKQVMTVDAFHVGLYDEATDIFSYSLFLNLEDDLQIPPRKLSERPGLTWEVISGRQTLYLPDVTDPETQRQHNIVIVVAAGLRSYIGIPLMLQERVIGVMSVQASQPSAYTSDQIRLLETLAGQVAITVEKLNLLEQLQKELAERKLLISELELKNAESETLRESTAIVAATLERSEAVQRILEQLKRVVSYDSASVWLYQGSKAVVIGTNNLPYEATLPGEIVLSENEPDYAFWSQDASYILIDDIQENYPAFREPPLDYIHGWLAIPLRARGKLTGYISLDSRVPQKFTRHDADLALTFANQVSIALENARLISDLQIELDERKRLVVELELRNAESETLRESAAIVAATLEQSEAVNRILEQLERVIHYDSASVQLLKDNTLEIVSMRGLNAQQDDIGARFPLDENEPSFPIFQNNAPYILYEDVQISVPAFNEIPHNNIHAWMAIPLKAKGRILGIIALDGEQPGQFSERDAQLAVTYANQVAIALENARLFSELQEKFAERQKLIEELENKNAELERFTYTVSHDLRSPLVTIRGFLGYLERDAQLAVTYANQVAIALENARLFSELQEKFTERQRLIEELENKNAELERFTYTVSHDLRSPLVTIRGFLGYLEKDASIGNMESFHKDMQRIINATNRMDSLLKDLLELSRVGRQINKPETVLFADLVKDAVEIVHGRLDARGVTLHSQPNLPLVHVDKPRLIEVLQNLIDNAAKYMGAQENPLIEIGTTGFDSSGKHIFFVRDNGIGIAPEYHQRIFGLFDKLDAASEGTGIGLALVKRIIEFHGGRIWVESTLGQGSIFYFTLQNALRD